MMMMVMIMMIMVMMIMIIIMEVKVMEYLGPSLLLQCLLDADFFYVTATKLRMSNRSINQSINSLTFKSKLLLIYDVVPLVIDSNSMLALNIALDWT